MTFTYICVYCCISSAFASFIFVQACVLCICRYWNGYYIYTEFHVNVASDSSGWNAEGRCLQFVYRRKCSSVSHYQRCTHNSWFPWIVIYYWRINIAHYSFSNDKMHAPNFLLCFFESIGNSIIKFICQTIRGLRPNSIDSKKKKYLILQSTRECC